MTEQSGRILVVDDEYSVRDSLSSWFRKDGHQVEVAENANEALRAMQEHEFDVMLVDIGGAGAEAGRLRLRY